jgi:GNAT superfamily N-acetyltransferase
MITIDLLKNHPECITKLAQMWHELLGKIWLSEIGSQEIESGYHEELNDDMPLAYVALYDDLLVGSCSLQLNDGIRPDLSPWLGDLIVDLAYQKQGIGKMLINSAKDKARELGFSKLYLFIFDPTLSDYYSRMATLLLLWRSGYKNMIDFTKTLIT